MRDYRNIFNKVVPYHTDDSMSLYEFVGKLYEWLKDFEGSLDEAHGKIDDFIHSFTMELDETTKKILTEWHDDGTLAELINLVWAEKADKTYVDSLVSQTKNVLTTNYTQADTNLRDQVNTDIQKNTQEIARVEGALGAKITQNETQLSSLRRASTIPDGTSIGAIGTGFWFASAGNSYTGMPEGQSWGHVLSWGTQAGMVVQLFFGNTKSYWRHWIAANQKWYGWFEMGVRTPDGTLVNGVDLHLLPRGVYSLGDTGSYTNGIGGMYGVLEVKEIGPRKYMTFHSANNTLYIKTYNNAVWSEWKEITGV